MSFSCKRRTADRLVILNFSLAGSVLSRKHGLATFVHEKLNRTLSDHSPEGSGTKWLCVDVNGVNIVNVYKPPPVSLTPNAIPAFPYSCLYAGDFNCRHTDWSYHAITPDKECLTDWAANSVLVLLHNPKDPSVSSLVA